MLHLMLCGGSGSRLWPLSNERHPKQFIHFFKRPSLLQSAALGNRLVCNKLMVVCHRDHYDLMQKQLNEVDLLPDYALLEPISKNTAPAVALALFALRPDEMVLMTPGDHCITYDERYEAAITEARQAASSGKIVLFGIQPHYPETGYGYIELNKEGQVHRFHEKPVLSVAREFLESGHFLWNSGMVCAQAGQLLAAFATWAPEIYAAAHAAYANAVNQAAASHILSIHLNDMDRMPSISLDYALLEKLPGLYCVRGHFAWSDVGSFDALFELFPKDLAGNAVDAPHHVGIDSKNNLLVGERRMMSTIEVEDLLVVDTEDALLIARKGSSQRVREVVNQVKERRFSVHRSLQEEQRPWGFYSVLEEEGHCKVKKLVVKPGQRLSLQQHRFRSEHWIVVAGRAIVTLDLERFPLELNQSIFLPQGAKHRLENPGSEDLVVIEVQYGEYIGEDDIIRLEDDYNRDSHACLSFGTGGLRGLMGSGPNRINRCTVMAATQALANYIRKQAEHLLSPAVFIGYDVREGSRIFAEISAQVLAANGIRAYLSSDICQTPLVSFGLRWKQCIAGIMVTASHNPPSYNGYKIYWKDGAQVVFPHDHGILQEMQALGAAPRMIDDAELPHPLIEWVGDELNQAYLHAVRGYQNYSIANRQHGSCLQIVYTSLHGAGITLMPQALADWGFNALHLVAEQMVPHPAFPTVRSPNPEERDALKLGAELLLSRQADLLLATDPDADRLGAAVLHRHEVHYLNGNQIACLCLDHLCKALKDQQRMPPKAAFIKTIATTELFSAIAKSYAVPCFNVLPGFKYIGQKIHQWESSSEGYTYLFGGEESYGYLLGTQSRDKDGVLSAMLLCEAALQAKLQGHTLVDHLHLLYRRHGMYVEKLSFMQFQESKEGREQIARRMRKLRKEPPGEIAGIKVQTLEDYSSLVKTAGGDGSVGIASDLLLFWLEDGSKVLVRPSGTEPKLKIYVGVVDREVVNLEESQVRTEQKAMQIVNFMQTLLDVHP